MCGIAGIHVYETRNAPVDMEELKLISRAMALRGPDDDGIWSDEEHHVGLAHRRLSIIDLTNCAAQPMTDVSNQYIVTFNGEIYNYAELKKQFSASGYKFKSNSDTEVLLAGYALHGADMVRMLRGMFAFAIWDTRLQQLFLARDPLGIKPLYYSNRSGVFRFASQVKALRAGCAGYGQNAAGHVGFFLWGHIPDPHTLFSDISSLPAASTMIVDQHGVHQPVFYWSMAECLQRAAQDSPYSELTEERESWLAAALEDTVRNHLVADVPVGIFLSAGIDSTTIARSAAAIKDVELKGFTLGFSEYDGTADNEVPLATLLANDLGMNHSVSWVDKNDFSGSLEMIMHAMDQPSTDGVNMYMVSQQAKRAGLKVALTGIGADELFGGYPSFRQVPFVTKALSRIPRIEIIGRPLRQFSSPILKLITSAKYAGLLEYGYNYAGAYLLRRALYMPWEIENILGQRLTEDGLQMLDSDFELRESIQNIYRPHAIVSLLETVYYMRDRLLRDADWASMAHSIEVRVPFADHIFIEKIASILNGPRPFNKHELAMSPRIKAPTAILMRPKTGFSVPIRDWLQQDSHADKVPERGIRGWAKLVYSRQTGQSSSALH